MKILVLNAHDKTVKVEEIGDKVTLADYLITLDCDEIDITQRLLDGKCFDIVFDAQHKLRRERILSASSVTNIKDNFIGNLIICNLDEHDNHLGLTDDDINHIKRHIHECMDKHGVYRPVLFLD